MEGSTSKKEVLMLFYFGEWQIDISGWFYLNSSWKSNLSKDGYFLFPLEETERFSQKGKLEA